MFFQEGVKPRISDFDRNGSFAYEAMLQVLETAGSHHSDMVHDHVIAGSQSGIAWILVEWRIKIHSLPSSTDMLKITTWVRGKAPAAMVYRDFIVTNDNDGLLFEAEATFVLLDTARGRMTRISEELFTAYGPEDRMIFEDSPARLRAPETVLFTHPLALRHSDIDFNGHIHNTKYIDIALEALPSHVGVSASFSEIRIVYSKAIKESDDVVTNYSLVNHAHVITVMGNNAPCTIIELK